MKISDRLRLVREHLGLTQPGAATKFGIPLGTYKQYEKGPSEPGAGALRGLADGGVNINWLLTGEGEMLLSDQSQNRETGTHNEFNRALFMRIFERLLEEDFAGHGMGKSYIAYFATLIYSRVISASEERRNDALETSVKELNLILLDGFLSNQELMIPAVQRVSPDSPYVEELQQLIEEKAAILGSLRGQFTERMLSPGSQLEGEFLKGLALSNSSDPK